MPSLAPVSFDTYYSASHKQYIVISAGAMYKRNNSKEKELLYCSSLFRFFYCNNFMLRNLFANLINAGGNNFCRTASLFTSKTVGNRLGYFFYGNVMFFSLSRLNYNCTFSGENIEFHLFSAQFGGNKSSKYEQASRFHEIT